MLLKLILAFAISPGFILLHAEDSISAEEIYIDERIANLKKRLDDDHLLEMKESVEGQGLMIADWSKYAEELKKVRKLEDQDAEILIEIEKLQELKLKMHQKKQQTPSF